MLKRISIIGSGSWATALVKMFSDSRVHVSWLVRSREQSDYINEHGRNLRYLSYAALNRDYITPMVNVEEAVMQSPLVLFALPSAYLKDMAERIKPEWIKNRQLAVSIKSFVPGTGYTPSAFLAKHFQVPDTAIVLGGPCHAEEIAQERNTYLTIAGQDMQQVKEVAGSIDAPYIKCVLNEDPSGVQYSAILKNIIGIATGIASGLHYGENFLAVLSSNAMREIKTFLNIAEIAPWAN
jgi:glycerol-3-phosphate dehydrogenase (NAD(P)+)